MKIQDLHQKFLSSKGICTDTRKIKKGELFFALAGENFDGNKYAAQAIEKGASYCIVSDAKLAGEKYIVVEDTLATLQQLSTFHRNYLDIPIIALTGSNGKTTTKELIASVLKTQYNCFATQGNYNNHIGVPLTLLSMDKTTEIGVVEMGANHLNEIAVLSEIADPDYGYITNIGKAHLEGFGSEENILIGKTELYRYVVNKKGILFCNAEDEKLAAIAKKHRSYFYSKSNTNHLYIKQLPSAKFVSVELEGTKIKANLIGNYNYPNLAASILIGRYFNISTENIKKAIESYVPQNNRSEFVTKGSNDIVMDAYNANPSSMEVALKNLSTMTTSKNTKIAILGDMFEMGKYATKEHQSIANMANNLKINKIYLVGTNFSKCDINSDKIKTFEDTNSVILHLKETQLKDSLLLIKGSRGMKMEQILTVFE